MTGRLCWSGSVDKSWTDGHCRPPVGLALIQLEEHFAKDKQPAAAPALMPSLLQLIMCVCAEYFYTRSH